MRSGLAVGPLRARLALLVVLALLPVVAASTIASLRQRSAALERYVEAARQTTVSIAADLDRVLGSTHSLLQVMAEMSAAEQGAPGCDTRMRDLMVTSPHLSNIGLVGPEGDVICAASPDLMPPHKTEWFDRVAASRDFLIASAESQPGRPNRALVVAHPIVRGSAVTGAYVATFDLGWLDRLLAGTATANGAVGSVLDPTGLILYRSSQTGAYVGTRPSEETLRRIRESDRAGTDTAGLDGVARRYVVVPWAGEHPPGLALIVGYSTSAVLGPFNRLLLTQSLFLALGVLVATLVVNRAARQLVLGPIDRLTSAIGRVRAGDLNARVEPGGGTELQELGDTFNLAVEGLRHRRELEEELRHAQRLQAVGHLAGGVAHEFNNMLAVILGNTELLLDEAPKRPEYTAIRDAAERSRLLTQQLLAFSSRQLLQAKREDLDEIVRHAVAGFARALGPRIGVHLRASGPETTILVDRQQINQVLLNVLLNARDAMPNGGTVTVETSAVNVVHGSVADLPDGRYGEVVISDTGRGMDEATLARALEPFFTTKPFGQGTGLGLATAYGIIRQSGGQLTLSSAVGAGTTVRIYLPAVLPPPVKKA